MKKFYINPELNVEKFDVIDVLNVSNLTTDGTDDWAYSPEW